MEMRFRVILFLILPATLTTVIRCGGLPDDQTPEAVSEWFEKLPQFGPPRITRLQFYFHNIFSGDGATSVTVARAESTAASPTRFGEVKVFDAPLTVGPDFDSEIIGYAQGMFMFMSREEALAGPVFTIHFTGGAFKGSAASLFWGGQNKESREYSIVGGSGDLRLARGTAIARNYRSSATNETLLYDFFVLHYSNVQYQAAI